MYHLQKDTKGQKKDNVGEQMSFLVTMMEDLKWTQNQMQKNMLALHQCMMSNLAGQNLGMPMFPTTTAAVTNQLHNPVPQPQLPNPWWINQAHAPPSFC